MNKVLAHWSRDSTITCECPICNANIEVNVDWIDGWIFRILSSCIHLSGVEVTEVFSLNTGCTSPKIKKTTFYLIFSKKLL